MKLLLRLLWIATALFVIVGSLLPPSSAPMVALGQLPVNDKTEHFGGYLLLGLLPALRERRRTMLVAAAAAVALGVGLEFLQPYFARDFEVADMLADAAGVACGAVLGLVLTRALRRSS